MIIIFKGLTSISRRKGKNILSIFKNLTDPRLKYTDKMRPVKDMTISDEFERNTLWKMKLDDWCEEKVQLEDNMSQVYGMVYGQCTEGMKTEIKSQQDYEVKHADRDLVWLLTAIKEIK